MLRAPQQHRRGVGAPALTVPLTSPLQIEKQNTKPPHFTGFPPRSSVPARPADSHPRGRAGALWAAPCPLSPQIPQRSCPRVCCSLPAPDSLRASRRTDCGTGTDASPGAGGHGWTPPRQLGPSSGRASPHSEPAQPLPRGKGIAAREEPGTHLIFRLASIVLSILGREQRRLLLQARGSRCGWRGLGTGGRCQARPQHIPWRCQRSG